MTKETHNINEKFLVYLLTCKIGLKMLDKLLIPFNIVGISTKVKIENFKALSHVCKKTCFGISEAQVTMVFSVMLS